MPNSIFIKLDYNSSSSMKLYNIDVTSPNDTHTRSCRSLFNNKFSFGVKATSIYSGALGSKVLRFSRSETDIFYLIPSFSRILNFVNYVNLFLSLICNSIWFFWNYFIFSLYLDSSNLKFYVILLILRKN